MPADSTSHSPTAPAGRVRFWTIARLILILATGLLTCFVAHGVAIYFMSRQAMYGWIEVFDNNWANFIGFVFGVGAMFALTFHMRYIDRRNAARAARRRHRRSRRPRAH